MNELYEAAKNTFAAIGLIQTLILLAVIVWTSSRERIRHNRSARKANRGRAGACR